MSEQAEVVGALEEAKIINLFEWAGRIAYGRVFQDFDEEAGHDQAIVGSLGYKYLINLLDRAGGCGKYALPEGTSPEAGLDLLRDLGHAAADVGQVLRADDALRRQHGRMRQAALDVGAPQALVEVDAGGVALDQFAHRLGEQG